MKKTMAFYEAGRLSGMHFRAILGHCWRALLIILCVSLFLKQYFSMGESYGPVDSYGVLMSHLGKMSTSLVMSLFLFLTLPPVAKAVYEKRPPPPLMGFYREHDLPLVVESLRAFVRILLWSLLLIIPGLIKQVQYLFMPFVVMFDPRYKDNPKFDPLKESEHLTRGLVLPLAVFMILSSLDLLVDSYSQPGTLTSYLLHVVSFLYTCFFHIFFFFVYMVRRAQIKADKK